MITATAVSNYYINNNKTKYKFKCDEITTEKGSLYQDIAV